MELPAGGKTAGALLGMEPALPGMEFAGTPLPVSVPPLPKFESGVPYGFPLTGGTVAGAVPMLPVEGNWTRVP
jgi:hypothetical protein